MKSLLLCAVICSLACVACGKKGPLSLPAGVESLPEDPSRRTEPPA